MEHTPEKAGRQSTLIIAEAGVNHNGDPDTALRLCDAAKDAGADIVKFQTWKTESLMLDSTPLAEYQKSEDMADGSQFAMAKALELPYNAFIKIRDHCSKIGIAFLSTPDEEDSLDFLTDIMGLEMIKIGSGEVTNIPFLSRAGMKKKDIILSTGMSALVEVEAAFAALKDNGARSISLLHCTSNYPAPYREVNLKAIKSLKEHFGVPVGYSDHTEGIEVAIAAVALGAVIIEKHLTTGRSQPGPDHKASIEPHEFKRMVDAIRNIEEALGDGIKRSQPSEEVIRKVVCKMLVARTFINKGEAFSTTNVVGMRAGMGIPVFQWSLIEGKPASRDYSPRDIIEIP